MHILIVEDESNVRQLLHEFAQEVAETVSECEDGLDAVAFCGNTPPDLVVMDINMPRMDGIEATETIHSMNADLPVVIVTQYDSEEYSCRAESAGAIAYFLKENLFQLRRFLRDWKLAHTQLSC